MDKISETRIGLSKRKMTLAFIASAIFVILGIQFIINSEKYVSPICRNIEFIKIAGFASLSFFGICLIYIFFKIFDTKPGLIINEIGITDNSHYGSVGLIDWSKIEGIRIQQVMSTKFLLIDVSNPKEFIEKSSRFKGSLMKANLRMYGTPLSITSNSLNYNFDDLEKLLHEEWNKYKSR
ncbi:STM3941 family protein [Flavobacterium sp. LHD-85]|uniref:STM3941 family protein n=1 Tax=Flavobacterium sp. LHD-85 TaxID=3071410 RepID=UPI0027E00BC2|nr:STM3941 family protein [Flavobacterium sp. LHD-85]MDQ6527881.1 STM3941 family protein [Flavobacterium sp. LHD-85]